MNALRTFFQISFCVELMASAFVFLIPMKKRLRLWVLPFVLLAALLIVVNVLWTLRSEILTLPKLVCLAVFLHMAILILLFYSCCQASLAEAMYAATCSYITQHVANSLYLLIVGKNYVRGDILDLLIPYALAYLTVYILAYFFLSKPFWGNWDFHISTPNNLVTLSLVLLTALYLSLECKIFCEDERIFRICQAYDILACSFLAWTQIHEYEKAHAKAEAETERRLWASRKAQYELSQENIAIINRKCHDLKHEVAALRNLKDAKLLSDSLKSIEQSIQIYDNTFQTGNRVLDTVLTEKSLLCEREQIKWTCMADGSLLDSFDALELYTLLGNALDNAIESVRQIEQKEKRVISVNLKAAGNFVHLQIINFCKEAPRFEDGLPQSTKMQDGYHGFGLKSIQAITEKNGGTMDIRIEDDLFHLSILLPIGHET